MGERVSIPIAADVAPRARAWVRGASGVVLAVSLLTLVDWVFGLALQRSIAPGLPEMKANTAVVTALLSLGGLVPEAARPRYATLLRLAPAIAALICGLTLIEHLGVLGRDAAWSIDQWIARDVSREHGRMAVTIALAGGALALAELALTAAGAWADRLRGIGVGATSVATIIAGVSLLGYLYSASALYRTPGLGTTSLASASSLALLGGATLLRTALDEGSSVLLSATASGATLRRIVPLLVGVPVLFGWVRLVGQWQGLYETEVGVALLATASVTVLVLAASRLARLAVTAELDGARMAAGLAAEQERSVLVQRAALVLRERLAATPIAVFQTDTSGACTFVNDRWLGLAELTLDEALGQGWMAGIHPDDRERVLERWQRTVARDGRFELEYRFRGAKTGTVHWVTAAATELVGPDGSVEGHLGYLVDISSRKVAEERLAGSEQQLRAILESAPIGVVVHDATKVLLANESFAQMTGEPTGDALLGRDLFSLIHADDQREVASRAASPRESGSPLRLKLIGHDRTFVAEARSKRVKLPTGPAIITMVEDVSRVAELEDAQRTAEANLRTSLHEKETLLKEIHHRVKNNLQTIASLLSLQASRLSDRRAQDRFAETQGRVHTIALLHEHLYRSSDLAFIPMAAYLRELADVAGRAHRQAGQGRIAVDVDASDIRLDMDRAVPLGLIANELISNAFKHAFPVLRRDGGRIQVRLARTGDEWELTVADDGVGSTMTESPGMMTPASVLAPDPNKPMPTEPLRPTSLGLVLVRSLARQIGATIEVSKEQGTRTTLRFGEPERGRDR